MRMKQALNGHTMVTEHMIASQEYSFLCRENMEQEYHIIISERSLKDFIGALLDPIINVWSFNEAEQEVCAFHQHSHLVSQTASWMLTI